MSLKRMVLSIVGAGLVGYFGGQYLPNDSYFFIFGIMLVTNAGIVILLRRDMRDMRQFQDRLYLLRAEYELRMERRYGPNWREIISDGDDQ